MCWRFYWPHSVENLMVESFSGPVGVSETPDVTMVSAPPTSVGGSERQKPKKRGREPGAEASPAKPPCKTSRANKSKKRKLCDVEGPTDFEHSVNTVLGDLSDTLKSGPEKPVAGKYHHLGQDIASSIESAELTSADVQRLKIQLHQLIFMYQEGRKATIVPYLPPKPQQTFIQHNYKHLTPDIQPPQHDDLFAAPGSSSQSANLDSL